MELRKVWIEQCEATRRIEDEFGTPVAEVKTIFEPWQLAEYLETALQTERFDPALYDEDDDPEDVELDRREDIERSARDLLLVERAREWLLEGDV